MSGMIGVNSAGADWLNIKAWIKTEIERLRDELEIGGDQLQRGQIMSLRKLMATVEPEARPIVEQDNYTMDPD